MKGWKKLILFSILSVFFRVAGFGEDIQERFGGRDKLAYGVYFNGIPVGHIEWEYLGQEEVSNKNSHVLGINSDANILELLNLRSKEKIFIDVKTGLPLKVERDVVFFGKKELIQEFYDQDQGVVKIVRNNDTKKEEVLFVDKPIHNILALLYFFPTGIDLEFGETRRFNLPTQKVVIKIVSHRSLKVNSEEKETYFLQGRGDKKFNLWLDKEKRLPLRLEFILLVGKIVIKREFEERSRNNTTVPDYSD
ncbi:MAG: hypothetical protein ABIH71_00495 [Candidatus Omnitrophota bacterium]|nr:hypothetical protein [Candidatus Omnitrophota bacterium]